MGEDTERRAADTEFKKTILQKIEHIERTLYDSEGNSNIRLMNTRQVNWHNENLDKIGRLQRALFNERDESRLAILEKGQAKIADLLGKGVFLKQLLIGIFSILVAGLELWRTFHP